MFYLSIRGHHLISLQGIRELRSKLVPYFSTTHGIHGQLLGPYSKLPSSSLRRLTLDLVVTIISLGGGSFNFDDNLYVAVCRAVAATGEQDYWEQLRKHYFSHL
jgi:pre-rRNA-processing protein IPI1